MKSLLVLVLALSTVVVFAFPSGYNTKEIYNGITTNAATGVTNAAAIISGDATNAAASVQKVVYTLPTTFPIAAGAVDTGLDIPATSIIQHSYIRIGTQIVSVNDNTIAFHCEGANDIYTATDLTDTVAAIIASTLTIDTESTYVYSATGCDVTMTVGAGASGLTAGALQLVIEYITL